jgi:hypothetical protein
MNKILYFLMVGFAFTVLQVGTVEAVKDCSDFTPGTPPFASCVADNQKTAGGAGMGAPGTAGMGAPGTAGMGAPGTAGMGAPGTAGMGAPGTAGMGAPGTAGMGAPGAAGMGDPSMTPPMGDPAAAPSMGERVKSFFGMGNDTAVPPTPGAAGMGAPGAAGMGAPGAAGMGAPGEAGMGDPSMIPPMGEHNDGPPIDPRSGQAFTQADEAKFQKYADECEATKGLLSEGSTQELVKEGFTQIQVEDLCKNGPQTAPPAQ